MGGPFPGGPGDDYISKENDIVRIVCHSRHRSALQRVNNRPLSLPPMQTTFSLSSLSTSNDACHVVVISQSDVLYPRYPSNNTALRHIMYALSSSSANSNENRELCETRASIKTKKSDNDSICNAVFTNEVSVRSATVAL